MSLPRLIAPTLLALAIVTAFASRGTSEDDPPPAAGAQTEEPPAPEFDEALLLEHLTLEFTRQFRPLASSEIRFVERVCRPTPEESRTLVAVGRGVLELAAKKYAEAQVPMHRVRFRPAEMPILPNPREVIQLAIAEAVRRTFDAEQNRRFAEETEKREAARKRTAMTYVIADLDKDLLLSPTQREELARLLEANWDDSWTGHLEALSWGSRNHPLPPDEMVLPLLSEVQQRAWRARGKTEPRLHGWSGFGFARPPEEAEVVEDAENVEEAEGADDASTPEPADARVESKETTGEPEDGKEERP